MPIQFRAVAGARTMTEVSPTTPLPVDIVSTTGGDEIQGNIAHDTADSGNPVKIGGKAYSSEPSAVTANDRVNAYFDQNGYLYVKPLGNVAAGAADAGAPLKVGGVYNSSAPTLDNGDRGNLELDVNGNLKQVAATMPSAEDNTNTVYQTQNKPLATNTYVWSVDQSAALEASSIAKASAGVLRSSTGRIDSSAGSATYYVQFLNSATVPADGAVTHLRTPIKVVHVTGTDSNWSADFTMNGIYGSAGLVIVLSSTEFTKTITAAYLSMTALYK